MQYVERAIGSVSKTWSSINPATLSGAIDVIVVEHPDGTLACSPFHVRFGKFQILKPSQKKVEVIVNGNSTNIPMKLADSGEAFFVFETSVDVQGIPEELLSSPVMSATSSPPQSPQESDRGKDNEKMPDKKLEEPDFLDINSEIGSDAQAADEDDILPMSRTKTFQEKLNRRLTQIHIPSKLDNNGDLLLDMEGYKPNKDKVHDTDNQLKQLLKDELGSDMDLSGFVKEDSNGNIRIVNPYEDHHHQYPVSPPESPPLTANESGLHLDSTGDSSTLSGFTTTTTEGDTNPESKEANNANDGKFFIKTLRLSSEQLQCLDLKYGENDLMFSVDQGRASVTSKLFVWRWNMPIVISDIDGTITKSDALGHVMTMFGKDWTHIGVAKLFTEIAKNGYNIMYLTARSTGQADSTRSYLRSIVQNGNRLPVGPVILSPDRTIAALRREVILKKPEVFKIACLNDMRSLYFDRIVSIREEEEEKKHEKEEEANALKQERLTPEELEEKPTPFFAGFGNRITDALSYRTVGIPSSRIFTINPDGEVHMELLELAGYKSSYVFINELVDHFFPPVANEDEERSVRSVGPGSPVNRSIDTENNIESNIYMRTKQEEKFTDVNFWREPLLDIDQLSDVTHSDSDVEDSEYDRGKSQDQILLSPPRNRWSVSSRDESPEDAASVSGTSLFQTISNDKLEDENHYTPQLQTPSRRNRPPTREEIGQQIYLELGSPLSPPQVLETAKEDPPSSPGMLPFLLSPTAVPVAPHTAPPALSSMGVGLTAQPTHRHASEPSTVLHSTDHSSEHSSELDEGLEDEFDEDEFT